jgi:hypothetical protein
MTALIAHSYWTLKHDSQCGWRSTPFCSPASTSPRAKLTNEMDGARSDLISTKSSGSTSLTNKTVFNRNELRMMKMLAIRKRRSLCAWASNLPWARWYSSSQLWNAGRISCAASLTDWILWRFWNKSPFANLDRLHLLIDKTDHRRFDTNMSWDQ